MENNTCLSRALCVLCTCDSYVYNAILIPYILTIELGSLRNRRQMTNLTLAPGRMVLTGQYIIIADALMPKHGL